MSEAKINEAPNIQKPADADSKPSQSPPDKNANLVSSKGEPKIYVTAKQTKPGAGQLQLSVSHRPFFGKDLKDVSSTSKPNIHEQSDVALGNRFMENVYVEPPIHQDMEKYLGLQEQSPAKACSQTNRKLCDESAKLFLLTTVPKGQTVHFLIKRHKANLGLSHPQYDMYLEGRQALICSAFKEGITSKEFSIYFNGSEQIRVPTNYIGKVVSNFTGSLFTFFNEGSSPKEVTGSDKKREVVGNVHFDQSFHIEKRPRAIDAYFPKPGSKVTNYEEVDLRGRYAGPNNADYIKLVTRTPQWDVERKLFVLNFRGRSAVKSPKNFIMIDADLPADQPDVLLMAKWNDDSFNLDVSYPLNPLQAFEVAVTAFAFKIGCQ